MKKLAIAAVIMLTLFVRAQSDFAANVAQASIKIAPERGVASALAWVTGTTAVQGQIVKYDNQYFMAEVATASVPGADANYRKLGRDRLRAVLVVCNVGTSTLWVNVGGPATVGKGMRLPPEWVIAFSDIQAAVHAIAEDATGGKVSGVDTEAN